MKNYRKHIDDFFREKLGWYFETPPSDVWEDLDARLDGVKPIVRKMPGRLFWHLAIVSSIIILGVSISGKILHNSSNTPFAGNTAQSTVKTDAAATTTQSGAAVQSNNSVATPGNNKDNNNSSENGNDASKMSDAPIFEHSDNTIIQEKNKETVAANNKQAQSNGGIEKPTSVKRSRKGTTGNAKEVEETLQSKPLQTIAQRTSQNSTANNAYSSSTPQTGEEKRMAKTLREENEENKISNAENDVLAARNKTDAVPTMKKDSAKEIKKQITEEKKNIVARKELARKFEIGIKGGYERGFNNQAVGKYVVSPYLQYNMSSKLSLMTQPAVKYAGVSTHSVGTGSSYYQVNEDGNVQSTTLQKTPDFVGGTWDTIFTTKYTYSQSHDSIVKSYNTGGSYMEFEIPLLLKYAVCPRFSVYGGVDIIYSKLMGIKENTYSKNGIIRYSDTTITNIGLTPAAAPQSNNINYTGTPFSAYKGPIYTNPQSSILTAGYMIGFSYNCGKRLLLDALLLQSPYKPNVIGGYNVNMPISSPYFRLTAGYRIIK